jgi:hypothetical protein
MRKELLDELSLRYKVMEDASLRATREGESFGEDNVQWLIDLANLLNELTKKANSTDL